METLQEGLREEQFREDLESESFYDTKHQSVKQGIALQLAARASQITGYYPSEANGQAIVLPGKRPYATLKVLETARPGWAPDGLLMIDYMEKKAREEPGVGYHEVVGAFQEAATDFFPGAEVKDSNDNAAEVLGRIDGQDARYSYADFDICQSARFYRARGSTDETFGHKLTRFARESMTERSVLSWTLALRGQNPHFVHANHSKSIAEAHAGDDAAFLFFQTYGPEGALRGSPAGGMYRATSVRWPEGSHLTVAEPQSGPQIGTGRQPECIDLQNIGRLKSIRAYAHGQSPDPVAFYPNS